MKRKLVLCTFVLATLLFSGCTRNNTQGTEHSQSETSQGSGSQSSTTHNSTAQGSTAQNTPSQGNTTQGNTTHADNTEDTMISEEEAKQIALSHAGLTSDQVTFIKSGLDRDNGRLNYDVEFYTNDNKEYEFEIDGHTGDIREWDVEAIYGSNS